MTQIFAIILVGLLAGCAPGLFGGGKVSDPALERILRSDRDVPARQGLLFMAMQDAEVARQSAGFAVVADHPVEAKAQIDNVLYAIDPSFPPSRTVTSSGVAPFWPGTGFGLQRAVQDIAEQMAAVRRRHDGREAVVQQAELVTSCAEETLARTDRVVSLGQQAIAASPEELDPLLAEIDRLTHIIMEAPAAEAANACSLEQARAYLNSLALQLNSAVPETPIASGEPGTPIAPAGA